MFTARIQNIVEKIGVLRGKPGTEDWFGAEKHRFLLNPPLPEPEVAAFETQHSIRLPEDHRQFLLLAGNGGVGPYYGLDPLSRWDEWFEEEAAAPDFVASPCPFVYDKVTSAAWRESLPSNRSDWGRGSIHICDQGCTFTARLVVSGESRGRVFNFEAHRRSVPPYFVKDGSFLDWYERWLDQALAGNPSVWFGYDNPAYAALGFAAWRTS